MPESKSKQPTNLEVLKHPSFKSSMLSAIKKSEGYVEEPAKRDPLHIPSGGHGFAYAYHNDDGEMVPYSIDYINKNFFPPDITGPKNKFDKEDHKSLEASIGFIKDLVKFEKEVVIEKAKLEDEARLLKSELGRKSLTNRQKESIKAQLELNIHAQIKSDNQSKLEVMRLKAKADAELLKIKANHTPTEASKVTESFLDKNIKEIAGLADARKIDLKKLNTPTRMVVVDNFYRYGAKFLNPNFRSTKALQRGDIGAFLLESTTLNNKNRLSGIDIRNHDNAKRVWDVLEEPTRKRITEEMKAHFNSLSPQDQAKSAHYFERLYNQTNKTEEFPGAVPNFMNHEDVIPAGPWPLYDDKGNMVTTEVDAQKPKQSPLGQQGSLLNQGTQYASAESANGGTEHVRAHTREGYPVRAYTRKA